MVDRRRHSGQDEPQTRRQRGTVELGAKVGDNSTLVLPAVDPRRDRAQRVAPLHHIDPGERGRRRRDRYDANCCRMTPDRCSKQAQGPRHSDTTERATKALPPQIDLVPVPRKCPPMRRAHCTMIGSAPRLPGLAVPDRVDGTERRTGDLHGDPAPVPLPLRAYGQAPTIGDDGVVSDPSPLRSGSTPNRHSRTHVRHIAIPPRTHVRVKVRMVRSGRPGTTPSR